MLPYCLRCRRNLDSKSPSFAKTDKGKSMFKSKYAVSNSKKSWFWKKEEDSDLSSSLGIKMLF